MTNPSTELVSSLRVSILRTVVPVLVGTIITAALRVGVDLDEGTITVAVTTLVTTLYYALVRLAETHLGPAWGWLLGYARIPTY